MEQVYDISLIYKGKDVDEGLIHIDDLADGLLGFRDCYSQLGELANVRNKDTIKIKGFRQGSFAIEIVSYTANNLDWIIPSALLLPSTILNLMLIKKFGKGKEPRKIEVTQNFYFGANSEEEKMDMQTKQIALIEEGLEDKKTSQSLSKIVNPLEQGKIDEVKYGVKDEKNNKEEEVTVNYKEKSCFNVSSRQEVIKKKTKVIGQIRAWDKSTNKGKFTTDNQNDLPAKFTMQDPEKYYKFFDMSTPVEVECEIEIKKPSTPKRIIIYDIRKAR